MEKVMNESPWKTLEEAARYLRVSRSTLYKMAEKGKVPCVKIGRQWRFNLAYLDAWLLNNHAKFV